MTTLNVNTTHKSARLTKTQIEYFVGRATEILDEAAAKAANKIPEVKRVADYTDEQKLAFIRSGKAKLMPNDKLGRSWNGRFDCALFSSFTYPVNQAIVKYKTALASRAKKVNALNDKKDAALTAFKDKLYATGSDGVEAALEALKNVKF